jgi:hypothetical protein
MHLNTDGPPTEHALVCVRAMMQHEEWSEKVVWTGQERQTFRCSRNRKKQKQWGLCCAAQPQPTHCVPIDHHFEGPLAPTLNPAAPAWLTWGTRSMSKLPGSTQRNMEPSKTSISNCTDSPAAVAILSVLASSTMSSFKIKFNICRKSLLSWIKAVFPFHAAAWKASSEPIRYMLQEPDPDTKNKLTAAWKDSTQAQLNTISITVSSRSNIAVQPARVLTCF